MVLRSGGAPENLIYTNPQYSSVTVRTNRLTSNYHSMQAQLTMRPMRGLNFQTTYTWSRNLGRQGISDYRDWHDDYRLNSQHRSHSFTTNGNYTLPFGANGYLFREAQGAFKKAIEGWSTGWIMSMVSGQPMMLSGIASLWSNSNYLNQVGPFDPKDVKIEWNEELGTGQYFGGRYMRIVDPQCYTNKVSDGSNGATALQGLCAGGSGIKALAEISHYNENGQPVAGQIIFQNAEAGTKGNYRHNDITGPGRFSLDMNFGKTTEFMEGKRLEIRIDAQNILNKATPSNGGFVWGARNAESGVFRGAQ
jgi:hypothetical protein